MTGYLQSNWGVGNDGITERDAAFFAARIPADVQLYEPLYVREMDVMELTRLVPANFRNRTVTREEFEHIGQVLQAFWKHDGDSTKPHAKLTSGFHSDGFINVGDILTYPSLCEVFAYSLARHIRSKQFPDFPDRPEWVIGSDHAAATFSERVGYWLNAVRSDFTEKGGADGKEQHWKRSKIAQGVQPVEVEELITSAATAERLQDGVQKFHDYPINFRMVATLVLRPDLRKHTDGEFRFRGQQVVAHYQYDIKAWNPKVEACPLCDAGSKAIDSPKQNWAALTEK